MATRKTPKNTPQDKPKAEPTTPLIALLRACSPEEREWLASQAGTEVNYLYALAGCHRGQPRLKLGLDIAAASVRLRERTDGRTPIVTAEQLASMCDVAGLDA